VKYVAELDWPGYNKYYSSGYAGCLQRPWKAEVIFGREFEWSGRSSFPDEKHEKGSESILKKRVKNHSDPIFPAPIFQLGV